MVGIFSTVAAGQQLATRPTYLGRIATPNPTLTIHIDLNIGINATSHTEQTNTHIAHHNIYRTTPSNNVDTGAAIHIGTEPPSHPEIQERGAPKPARKPSPSEHITAPPPQRPDPRATGHG
jgi:hypothetical protein